MASEYSFEKGLMKGARWVLILAMSATASAGLTDLTVKDIVLFWLDWSGVATISIGAILTILLNFMKVRSELRAFSAGFYDNDGE